MRDIEESIIGSLLIDDRSITKVLYLTPEMFEDDLYSAVFRKIRTAFEAGQQVDATTIAQDLGSDQLPAPYISRSLGECIGKTITSANIGEYGKRLLKEYKRKEAERMIENIMQADDVDAALTDGISKMASLTSGGTKHGHTIAELADKYKGEYFREKERDYLYFGIESIDHAIGGCDRGDITVIAARPGVGKSALSLQIARNIAAAGKRVAYFILEMPDQQIYERIISAESGVGMQQIRHSTSARADDFHRFMDANDRLNAERNMIVFDDVRTAAGIRQLVMTEHYDVVVIDYLQLMTPATGRGANRTAEVGDISRDLKKIAMDFKIHVIALSQLNRASVGANKEPTMADIRESGAIEQDASNILIIWDADEADETKKTLKVDKARNGKRGRIDLLFDGAHMKFSEVVAWTSVNNDCPFT